MMKRRMARDGFYDQLMHTNWFPETVDHYFGSDYRPVFDKVIKELHQRHIIKTDGSDWITTVRP